MLHVKQIIYVRDLKYTYTNAKKKAAIYNIFSYVCLKTSTHYY